MDQNKCYNSVSTSVVPPDKKKEYDNDRVFPSLEFSSFNFFPFIPRLLDFGSWSSFHETPAKKLSTNQKVWE